MHPYLNIAYLSTMLFIYWCGFQDTEGMLPAQLTLCSQGPNPNPLEMRIGPMWKIIYRGKKNPSTNHTLIAGEGIWSLNDALTEQMKWVRIEESSLSSNRTDWGCVWSCEAEKFFDEI